MGGGADPGEGKAQGGIGCILYKVEERCDAHHSPEHATEKKDLTTTGHRYRKQIVLEPAPLETNLKGKKKQQTNRLKYSFTLFEQSNGRHTFTSGGQDGREMTLFDGISLHTAAHFNTFTANLYPQC